QVRIINGEIVSDDDPRVSGARQRPSSRGGGGGVGGEQGRVGYGGRVASLLDPPPTGASGGGSREPAAGGAGGQPGLMDKLAEMIGVHGRSVTIPGALGVQEQQLPFIYIMIAAVVVLFAGWKAAGVIIFAYVITNQKGRTR
ncbi:unnamed protein product, partial [Hapterophycus canaliculatus]